MLTVKHKCSRCIKEKPLYMFKKGRLSHGAYSHCKECEKELRLQTKFNISQKEYNILSQKQNNVCGICKGINHFGHALCVDHDHYQEINNNKIVIRGLLCKSCNLGIGKLGDTIERMQKSLEYLHRSIIYFSKSTMKPLSRKHVKMIIHNEGGIIKRNCTECHKIKILQDFPNCTAGKFGKKPVCKVCDKKAKDSWALKKLYGISVDQYEELVKSQNGLCAICENKPNYHRLCVDHDHSKTNEANVAVRGLLCQDCNMGLGKLGDTQYDVLNALNYIKG